MKGHPEGCMCRMCQGSGMQGGMGYRCGRGGWGWAIVRLIIALIIVGVVFCIGVMVGELRVLVNGGYRMMHYSGRMMYPGQVQPGGPMIPATTSTTPTSAY